MIADAPAAVTLAVLPTSTSDLVRDALPTSPAGGGSRPSAAGGTPLSLRGVTAALQIVLAARRAKRHDDLAYWYAIARGL